jgi:hypothetical protein
MDAFTLRDTVEGELSREATIRKLRMVPTEGGP